MNAPTTPPAAPAYATRLRAAYPERFTRGTPRPATPRKEVWIDKPRIVTLTPIPGTTTQLDAQRSTRTNDLDPGREGSTPDSGASELLEVV